MKTIAHKEIGKNNHQNSEGKQSQQQKPICKKNEYR